MALSLRKLNQLAPAATFLLGCMTAFGNSTSYNGFVQTNGETGIEFGTLDSGNYRLTITSSGQLNFRYSVDGQTFDSNPEVAIMDLQATTVGPIGYASTSATYNAVATYQVAGGGTYNTTFQITASTLPALFLSEVSANLSSYNATPVIGSSGNLPGGDLTSYTPIPVSSVNVPGGSLIAQSLPASDNGGFYGGGWGVIDVDDAVNNPEPGTFVMIGGALLSAGLLRKRLVRR